MCRQGMVVIILAILSIPLAPCHVHELRAPDFTLGDVPYVGSHQPLHVLTDVRRNIQSLHLVEPGFALNKTQRLHGVQRQRNQCVI